MAMKYTPKHELHERQWCISQHPAAWREWSAWYLGHLDASNADKQVEQRRLKNKYAIRPDKDKKD